MDHAFFDYISNFQFCLGIKFFSSKPSGIPCGNLANLFISCKEEPGYSNLFGLFASVMVAVIPVIIHNGAEKIKNAPCEIVESVPNPLQRAKEPGLFL